MRSRFLLSLFLALPLVGIGSVLFACASDHPPPAGSSSSSGVAPIPTGTGTTDGGTDAPAEGGGCQTPTQHGQTVEQTRVKGTPPPPLGGVIPLGSYVLVELIEYSTGGVGDGGGNVGLTGKAGRTTLVLTANGYATVGARGDLNALPTDAVVSGSYTTTGTSLNETPECPSAGPLKSFPYSSVGNGLAILVDANHREIYTKE